MQYEVSLQGLRDTEKTAELALGARPAFADPLGCDRLTSLLAKQVFLQPR